MKGIFILTILIGGIHSSHAQLCTGSLGDPVVNISFGVGPNPGEALSQGQTSYEYFAEMCPEQAQYSFLNLSLSCNDNSWHSVSGDHTGTDPNGYYLLVNSQSNKGVLYSFNVKNLCPNTTYEFATWIKNVLRPIACEGAGVDPNLRLTVETKSGTILATYLTGNIAKEASASWKQFGMLFTTPAVETEVVLRISNTARDGCGNVLALDDITVRPCGAKVNAVVSSNGLKSMEVCEGADASFLLSATYGSTISLPAFQWQIRRDTSGWNDIPGANSSSYLTSSQTSGWYFYRMIVSDAPPFSSQQCRLASNEVTVSIERTPLIQATNYVYGCLGGDITLLASGASKFQWTGPNGFTSTLQRPVLKDIKYSAAGLYKVTGTTNSGCQNSDSSHLSVFPNATASSSGGTSICEGASATLFAGGGVRYQWEPATGLSNDTIAAPMASPLENTSYKVKVTNQYGCSDTANVKINVWKKPVADAGPDLKTRLGVPIVLRGNANGTDVSWSWTPPANLSASTALNPTANPQKTAAYKLQVTSTHGCGTSIDEVVVKVYDKLEIPNAFSPNGDGVNDTWHIETLEVFSSSDIKVYNRFGQLVYRNKGYSTAWNGTCNGKTLPPGTYYYVIDLRLNKEPKITGSVTIVK